MKNLRQLKLEASRFLSWPMGISSFMSWRVSLRDERTVYTIIEIPVFSGTLPGWAVPSFWWCHIAFILCFLCLSLSLSVCLSVSLSLPLSPPPSLSLSSSLPPPSLSHTHTHKVYCISPTYVFLSSFAFIFNKKINFQYLYFHALLKFRFASVLLCRVCMLRSFRLILFSFSFFFFLRCILVCRNYLYSCLRYWVLLCLSSGTDL